MAEAPVDQPRSAQPQQGSLDSLFHAYDREVARALDAAMAAPTGTDRVRTLHDRLGPALVVHDTMLSSALCPVLDGLPGGPAVADRVRSGCRRRADALRRFDDLTRGVASHNVYGTSADEVDDILAVLEQSFATHRTEEADAVRGVLTAAGAAVDAATVSERMATAARRAPTRAHGHPGGAPPGALALATWRQRDRLADWVDAHHGWTGAARTAPSPRRRQMAALQRLALGEPATVPAVLSAYDAAVDEEFASLERAETDAERGEAAHRAAAAVAIHDAVVGGVVCPLLRTVPGGGDVTATLRRQCEERADLLQAWVRLTRRARAADLYREQRPAVDEVMDSLQASFAAHQHDETAGVTALLQDLPPERYRTGTAPFADSMWPWHSEGPNLLALRMAIWAGRSPTRPHPCFLRHPSSRVLRTAYSVADHLHDRWHDTPLTRWLFPSHPAHPLAAVGMEHGSTAGGAAPEDRSPSAGDGSA